MRKRDVRIHTRMIRDCGSWADLYRRLKETVATDRKAAGDAFEVFVQAYLRTHPTYQAQLTDVWLLHQVPADVRAQLGLGSDEGVDLVARTVRGDFWAIQAKFVGDPDEPLTRAKVNSFVSFVFHARRGKFTDGFIAHISTKPIRKRRLLPSIHELGLDRWLRLDDDGGAGWRDVVAFLKRGEAPRPKPREPWPHVTDAIDAAVAHFATASRGRLKMACGTGKSMVALWTARAMGAKTILVVVPSLQLVQRAVEDWSREYLANGERPAWMCVCSDDTVVDDVDDFVTDTYELGLQTETDPRVIAEWLRDNGGTKIVFATYQSSEAVAEAARLAGVTFDVAIFDEAHRTVGRCDKAFARLLRDDFKARRRMFMTATERVVNGADGDEVYSMDDESVYGRRFHTLEFGEAIDRGIITPFQIVTYVISETRIRELIKRNRHLRVPGLRKLIAARDLAAAVALNEAIDEHGIQRAIAYCPSILAGKRARDRQDELCASGRWVTTANFHVSSQLSAGERAAELRRFEDADKPAIIFNARCLTEGVDIGTQKGKPVDAVAFTSPRRSVVDIVQAAGRAMRRGGDKTMGYILVPIVVPDDMDVVEFANTTPFKEVVRIIRAMALADPRIVDELRAVYEGRIASGRLFKFKIDERIGAEVALDAFAAAITTRVWEVVARYNGMYRSFADARAFVHGLGLKNMHEWREWSSSDNRPPDIPTNPNTMYPDDWVDLGDWLGSGTKSWRDVEWRSFEDVRAFVRGLGIKSKDEWFAYCKTGQKPEDVPSNINKAFPSDWKGWPAFLGTKNSGAKGVYRSFEDARAFARSLGCRSQTDWHAFCQSGERPRDIPTNPRRIYAKSGWVGWGDWFGTGRPQNGSIKYKSFKAARAFVRSLGLATQAEWIEYWQAHRTIDIPCNPSGKYRGKGWAGWPNFLGTERGTSHATA